MVRAFDVTYPVGGGGYSQATYTFSADVPAAVCGACGAAYLSAEALAAGEYLITRELVARGVGGGAAAKWLRKSAGMTREGLAVLLGVGPERVAEWEQDRELVDRATLLILGDLALDAVEGRTRTLDRLRVVDTPPTDVVHVRAA